ncbi:MAG: DUF2934 domain-containing protein [Polyangiales bacterium]
MAFSNKRSESKSNPKPAPVTPINRPATEAQSSTPAPAAPRAELPEELVSARAYEIWQRRGSPAGGDTESDWFAARAELEQEALKWAAPQPDDRERGR